MTKQAFKNFVKNHPELITHVKNGKMSWQKFYEIYDIYGEDDKAWKDFLEVNTVFDITAFLKNLNLDGLKEGINNVQRVLGLIQDINPKANQGPSIKPKPLYKHFED